MGRAASTPPATVAGRYEIERELARGGMGVVYRAFDHTSNRGIALKRSLAGQGGAFKNRLQREYQTLVTLRHPHIIQVYDFGIDEIGAYYTMELLDGADLRTVSPLGWRDVCRYLRDVTSSLALLHSRRLLHCDVGAANVRLTGEGRAKLIDFGALASFGKNKTIAGTPPTTPPEVLDRLELDQAVDLYALGATAYYALTGRHAYHAKTLAQLREVWERGVPEAPSVQVPDVPRELDELVMSLLDLDRTSRPRSAAEVIDRLDAIAGLPPDQDERVVRSYLLGTGLVGRDEERRMVRERLSRAWSGDGGGVLIAGGDGLGKSALLDELLREAKIAGARVVSVDARVHRGPAATWTALVREAQQAGAQSGSQPLAAQTPEQLSGALATRGPLVIAVEDLHRADVDSLTACAKLTQSLQGLPILFAATADFEHAVDAPGLRALRERLPHVELEPFDARATQAFVEGLFGQVPAAPRLSAFLQDHALGNPRTYAELMAHFIERGFIRYAEGTWVLPRELPVDDNEVGAILDAAFARRFARWSPSLRRLAICLSPHRSRFDIELCHALTAGELELRTADLGKLLTELVCEGALGIPGGGTYAFVRKGTREFLYGLLDEAERKRQHARIARILERSHAGAQRGFEIGIHFFLAGEHERARRHINQNLHTSLVDPDRLVSSIGDLWTLLGHQRTFGASDQEVALNEAVLVVSGHYVDPTVHERLGYRALAELHESTGLLLATRLERWLGGTFAVLVGVLWACCRRLFKKRDLFSGTFLDSLLAFIGACSVMGGAACVRLDHKVHPHLLGLLSVARGFGPHNGLRLVYDLLSAGALLTKGRFSEAHRGLEAQLERLPKVPFFHEQARHHYAAGLHFFIGRSLLLRGGAGVLQCAERIEALGAKQDLVMAQFLRRTHYLYRGELEAVKREERKLDYLAGHHGARWAPDMLAAIEFLPYHLAGDVLGLKQALHRIEGFLAIAPGLAVHRNVAEAMYEGHRGRADVALAIYTRIEAELAPFSDPIWAAARAHQAECLNALGRSAEALAVCEAALSQLSVGDRVNLFAYQQLEREAALALSGLGQGGEAGARLDGLIARCPEEVSPLLHGLLHYDRARIAAAAADGPTFERHAEAARATFTRINNPVLITRSKRLVEIARNAGLPYVASATSTETREGVSSADAQQGTLTEQVLSRIAQACEPRSAELHTVVCGRAISRARLGVPAPPLDEQLVSITLALNEQADDDEVDRILTQVSLDMPDGASIVPLLSDKDGERHLVAVLTLIDCARPEALTTPWLAQLAKELSEAEHAP